MHAFAGPPGFSPRRRRAVRVARFSGTSVQRRYSITPSPTCGAGTCVAVLLPALNMTDIVNHYLLAAIGNEIDLGDQLEYIIANLEANKKAIIEDIINGA